MVFLISLLLAFVFSWYGAKAVKKHAGAFYAASAVLSAAVIVLQYTGAFMAFPAWVIEYVWPVFANCSFATALFVVVMFMGALPNGSSAIKRLMPVRAELSIMACILTLGHNIGYGRTYFVKLFTDPAALKGAYLWAAVVSVVLILLMLPLMVTSFPAVRKKMKPKSWKKLQRTAYLFYALIYVHVLILNSSFLAAGRMKYLPNLLLYTAVFAVYAAMRSRKALVKKNSPAAVLVPAGIGIAAAVLLAAVCVPAMLPSGDAQEIPVNPETAAVTAEETAEQNGEGVKDGVYTGKGNGYTGEITMSVTITDGAITAVDVVEAAEDEPFWSKALRLTEEIISKQSTDLDTVTAATISSEAILEAVNNALASAGWTGVSPGQPPPEPQTPETQAPETEISETEASETEVPETVVPETEAPETEAPETKAPETEAPETKAPETKAPETKVPETKAPETKAPETKAPETKAPETKAPETKAPETKAPETKAPETKAPETKAPETKAPETKAPETKAPETKAPETKAPETQPPETQAPAAVTYKDGAYFGVGEGFNGDIQVAVMIAGGKITSVIVVSSSEDASYLANAQGVIDDIIAVQGTAVDTVTGATFSSKGIIAAVADALNQAAN